MLVIALIIVISALLTSVENNNLLSNIKNLEKYETSSSNTIRKRETRTKK